MPTQPLLEIKPTFLAQTGMKLGRKIYDAGPVQVYQIGKDKVVKISHAYDNDEANHILKLCRYFKKSKNKAVVNIHQFGTFTALPPSQYTNSDLYYYYVMDRLKLMPRKMMSKFYLLCEGLSADGKVDSRAPKSVKTFVKHAKKLKYYYGDLHKYNVLRANNGSLKFIDLESFYE